MNQKYPRKRALYLAGLAQHLKSSSDIGTMRYSCLHGNRLRPVLLLTPPGISLPINSVPHCMIPVAWNYQNLFFPHSAVLRRGLFFHFHFLGKNRFTVRVHVLPPPGFFKPSRFHPQRNNIRTEWYTGLQTLSSGKKFKLYKEIFTKSLFVSFSFNHQ